jgi:hypothetical protein
MTMLMAEFLKAVEAKYGQTDELPDGKPPAAPKVVKEKQPKNAKAPKAPAPTVDELLTTVAALKVKIRADQTLTKDGVAAELARFKGLSQAELFGAVETLGIQAKQKNMSEAIKTTANHTVSAQGGVERSDA